MKSEKLHVISTGRQKPEQLADIMGVIHSHIDFIHLREKNRTAKEVYELVGLRSRERILQSAETT